MKKNKEKIFELIRYLIVGVLTTGVSLAIYYGLVYTILNPESATELQIANIISWVGSVIFAYITNRIFVFKSKNQNKIKEIINFTGSRVVTLLMDMAIMFLGVTILKLNDKIIKLISQVVIIVANYVFSKLFVFNNSKKEKREKKIITSNMLYYVILVLPLVDLIKSLFPDNLSIFWGTNIIKGAILLYFILRLIKKKQSLYSIFFLLGFIAVEILYAYSKNYNIIGEITFLLNVFFIPVSLLYIGQEENLKLNDKFLTKVFFSYLVLLLIPFVFNPFHIEENFAFYYAKTEIIGVLILLLPIFYTTLKKHSNRLAQILGVIVFFVSLYFWKSKVLYITLLITIVFFLWKDRKNIKKEIIFIIPIILLTLTLGFLSFKDNLNTYEQIWGERLNSVEINKNVFQETNLEEKIFGLKSMEDIVLKETKIDLFDIFTGIGYLGIIIYLFLIISAVFKAKLKSYYLFSLVLVLFISFISGHILISATLGIWLFCLGNAGNIKEKKKILLISNMYPSKKNRHYGSFVKNTYLELESLDYQMDKVIMKKHINKIYKVINYIRFYLIAFLKSVFNSYDYIYVHFVSHSTFPVILGRITSNRTKLICNVHGNDIVADYEWENRNVQRSKKVLKYADKVVVPSVYFQTVVKKEYNIPDSKIVIYPSGGVNFEVFTDLNQKLCKQELDLDENITYIGCVTRIEKDKGWDTLIKAIVNLKKESFMKKTKFIIIGSGVEQEELKNMIHELKLEEYVIQKDFVFQNDLVKYYNAFNLFIFPTKRKSESLGLVGLEAMATKTFTIICNLYGPQEYAINKETSLTYQKDNDGKILAEKIKEYMKMNVKERNNIITNAYKMAQKYDKNELQKKLKEICQDE